MGQLQMTAKLLIVEDEQALSELLRYNFEAEGFHVTHCESGEEAEIIVAEETPDIVVLDWMLPSVSGIELCRRMRSKPETRNIPIIMLTGQDTDSDTILGLEAGANDYVNKPFKFAVLLARIRAHLRQHERVTEADRAVQDSVKAFHKGKGDPLVRHLIAPAEGRSSARG